MHDPDNGQLRWVRQLLPDGQVLLLLSALLVVGCSGSAEHISVSLTSTPTPASAARLSTVSVTPSGTNSAPPAITGPSFPKPAGIQPPSAPLTELLSFGRPAVEMNGPNGIAVDAQQNVYIGE